MVNAAGYRNGEDVYCRGTYGYYWSAALSSYYSYLAYCLYFYYGNYDWSGSDRDLGRTVRSVTD